MNIASFHIKGLYKDVGKQIKEIRVKSGFSQYEAAIICGMSGSQLSRYETGKTKPRKATLRKMEAELLVTKLDWSTYNAPRSARMRLDQFLNDLHSLIISEE